ncbi:FeoB-associated Cys-rich membrane protein [Exiguobacterium sp. SH0S1]|uniref:FeoB-associated Cys-rich membrane protein n=1 Tax=Exiguobacterium sp. SH0S1 TaxID=2510949 RepID=UPI00103F79B6|nr:FeoB-associated Cys-rich membrane protein [Exiguobacterium sp. SH0S1]TCI76535.1 FeoB-associated Cys-rich membrane protein [Exiguobacterium sp. SH0S1]
MFLFDLLIGLAVFGYAAYSLYRYTRKAKAGKCATCEIAPTCTTSCDAADWDQIIAEALHPDQPVTAHKKTD